MDGLVKTSDDATPPVPAATRPPSPGAGNGALRIDWADLTKPAVDARLQQLETVRSTLNHYDASGDIVATAPENRFALFYHAAVYLAVFGLIGGLLGWTIGQVVHARPDARAEARELIAAHQELQADLARGEVVAALAQDAMRSILRDGAHNPYFAIYADPSLSVEERSARERELAAQDAWKDFLANTLFYGFAGMLIAVCLAAAEPIIERNLTRATINAAVGAVLGMIGGVAVALLIHEVHGLILGGLDERATRGQQILAKSLEWGILGFFLAAAPGVLMGSFKRLLIGVLGGLIGGMLGGLLFVPLSERFGEAVGRLGGLVAIGTIAGVACGLLENAVKSGWIKVIKGAIAGKQFVLYRNPTYIGAHPSCHIYLFKDPAVGKRHAALHLTSVGVELEDLPLGTPTRVNGQPIQRAILRDGDQVQVGKTLFQFHEKRPTTAAPVTR